MKKIGKELKNILKEASNLTFTLLKIMIPISITVKLLGELGIIELIGKSLSPIMNIVGLPGEFGLVWSTTMITNIYGGLLVFLSLAIENQYTTAQVTILAAMMLIAHTLPIELRIAQKAGVRLWFMFSLRVFGAFLLGGILNVFYKIFNLHNNIVKIIWNPGYTEPTLINWIITESKNYIIIFLIIFGILILMKILTITGILDKLNKILKPALEFLGMSKEVAPITIIGMTLGLSYGGGLIIKQTKSHLLSKKDVFLSLSLMGLSHSLIEDTLLMVTIGAALSGILLGRFIFTIIIIFILIRIIKHLSDPILKKCLISS